MEIRKSQILQNIKKAKNKQLKNYQTCENKNTIIKKNFENNIEIL